MTSYLVAGYVASPRSSASMLAGVIMGSGVSRLGVLASFWYYSTFDMTSISKDCPLILDSGAFSAYSSGGAVSLVDYARWVEGMSRPYDFAFTLDVLGDPVQSLANWRSLRDLGVDTVPVLHYGTLAGEFLPAYLEGPNPATRIALGGLATGKAGPQALSWAAHVLAWMRDHAPATPTHGLGVHPRSHLAVLPFTTIDSSSFSSAWRYARAMLWNPITKRWVSVQLDGSSIFKYGKLVRYYGFEPSEVAESSPATRESLIRLIVRSEARAVADLFSGKTYYLVDTGGITNLGPAADEASFALRRTRE